jgi:hypothetical protein
MTGLGRPETVVRHRADNTYSRTHSCHLRVSGMRHQHPVSISIVTSSAMKTIDLSAMPAQTGSNYPRPFDVPCSGLGAARSRT